MGSLLVQVAIFIVRRNMYFWKSYKNGDFSLCREGNVALMQASCSGTITPVEKMDYNRFMLGRRDHITLSGTAAT